MVCFPPSATSAVTVTRYLVNVKTTPLSFLQTSSITPSKEQSFLQLEKELFRCFDDYDIYIAKQSILDSAGTTFGCITASMLIAFLSSLGVQTALQQPSYFITQKVEAFAAKLFYYATFGTLGISLTKFFQSCKEGYLVFTKKGWRQLDPSVSSAEECLYKTINIIRNIAARYSLEDISRFGPSHLVNKRIIIYSKLFKLIKDIPHQKSAEAEYVAKLYNTCQKD